MPDVVAGFELSRERRDLLALGEVGGGGERRGEQPDEHGNDEAANHGPASNDHRFLRAPGPMRWPQRPARRHSRRLCRVGADDDWTGTKDDGARIHFGVSCWLGRELLAPRIVQNLVHNQPRSLRIALFQTTKTTKSTKGEKRTVFVIFVV